MKAADIIITQTEMPEAFCDHFVNKVKTIEAELRISPNVYNGTKTITSPELNFMTEKMVKECIDELKTKNCEGIDRIPLRILKDGSTALFKPLAALFNKIYETKSIPEQWKIAKVIPLHKKGDKQQMANYRPISNLCSVSKVFEKLIQKRLETLRG